MWDRGVVNAHETLYRDGLKAAHEALPIEAGGIGVRALTQSQTLTRGSLPPLKLRSPQSRLPLTIELGSEDVESLDCNCLPWLKQSSIAGRSHPERGRLKADRLVFEILLVNVANQQSVWDRSV